MITSQHKATSKRIIMYIFVCLVVLLIIISPEEASEGIYNGINLCARSIIPSLFPFMIVSELIVSGPICRYIEKMFGKLTKAFFRLPRSAACPIFFGLVFGFPVGARMTMELLNKRTITRSQAQYLQSFCNIPSAAFIVNFVGSVLYSSKLVGIVIYTATVFSAILVGLTMRPKSSQKNECSIREQGEFQKNKSLVDSVSSATQSVITVCSFVVFFCAVANCLAHWLCVLCIKEHICAIIFSFIEISAGVSAAAKAGHGTLSVMIASFAIGWSGLSVHLQLMAICKQKELCYDRYIISKILHGAFNAIIVGTLFLSFPSVFLKKTDITPMPSSVITVSYAISRVFFVIFLVSFFITILKQNHKKSIDVIY